jgi:hypothetical protein
MSLIAAGYGNEPTPPDEIQNNGFWPGIDPADFRAVERIDSNITAARVEHALRVAIADINRQLASWQQAQQQAGAAEIAEVAAPTWAIEGHYAQLYRRALYATAHATLLERYRDTTATGQGDERGEAKAAAADDYRRDARWAVAEIEGRTHTTVELI